MNTIKNKQAHIQVTILSSSLQRLQQLYSLSDIKSNNLDFNDKGPTPTWHQAWHRIRLEYLTKMYNCLSATRTKSCISVFYFRLYFNYFLNCSIISQVKFLWVVKKHEENTIRAVILMST